MKHLNGLKFSNLNTFIDVAGECSAGAAEPDKSRTRLAGAFASVAFSEIPSTVEEGKWTKTPKTYWIFWAGMET